jgi:hypothetical protein
MFDKTWKSLLVVVLAVGVCVGMIQARYTLVPVSQLVVVEYDHITGHTRVGEIDRGTIGRSSKPYGHVVWLKPPPQ